MLRLTIVNFLFLLSSAVSAQDISSLRSSTERLQAEELLKNGRLSVSVRNSETGEVLYGHKSSETLTPASNLKLLTTATALDVLGPDFTFKTYLEYSGNISNGTLNGNIYIRGTGDPSLGSDRFEGYPELTTLMDKWYQAIADAGIKKINGQVIADASLYDRNIIPGGWVWTDIGNYFGAGPSALNINENIYRIFFRITSEGDPAEISRTEPDVPYMNFINNVSIGAEGSGDNAYIYGGAFSSTRYLEGTVPAGYNYFSIKGSLPDPAYFTAWHLNECLKEEGINTSGQPEAVYSGHNSERKVLVTIESPPLSKLVEATNEESINLYAEALLAYIGKEKNGNSDARDAAEWMKEYWNGKGLNTSGLFLYDGSGLSPSTGATAAFFTSFLSYAKKQTWYDVFYNSIPVVGEEGTVKYMGRGTAAANGNVRVKSGSLQNVISYSGYVKGNSGQLYTVSVLVNYYDTEYLTMRKRINELLVEVGKM